MTDLLALAERVKALTEPDRKVDAAVFRALGCPLPAKFASYQVDLIWQDDGSATMPIGDMQIHYTPPAYTASVDVVLALITEKLPGWRVAEMKDGIIDDAYDRTVTRCLVRLWCPANAALGHRFPSSGTAPCQALLAATLRALASQDPVHD